MEKLYTPDQIAKFLQIDHLTVLKYIRDRKIKAIKLGRIYRIKEKSYNEFLERMSA